MVQEHASQIRAGAMDGGADWRVALAVTQAFVAPRIGETISEVKKELGNPEAGVVSALLRLVSSRDISCIS